ncbi:hypothetical protein BG261_08030 [Floricoccus tropicus]|uniref:Uncharacterized protein n=1 Tax=Floricoccus tropicus TaxID=1859473 RepID=A0A1E8GIW9_9LACT|nr:hypothetical protein BG261_08030 [Floricoccus tropicus]
MKYIIKSFSFQKGKAFFYLLSNFENYFLSFNFALINNIIAMPKVYDRPEILKSQLNIYSIAIPSNDPNMTAKIIFLYLFFIRIAYIYLNYIIVQIHFNM